MCGRRERQNVPTPRTNEGPDGRAARATTGKKAGRPLTMRPHPCTTIQSSRKKLSTRWPMCVREVAYCPQEIQFAFFGRVGPTVAKGQPHVLVKQAVERRTELNVVLVQVRKQLLRAQDLQPSHASPMPMQRGFRTAHEHGR